jgi:hypothetical protein
MAVAHRALDGRNHVRRRAEPERDRVADVQVTNPCSRGLHSLRFDNDISDGVTEAVDS